ncbi:ComF operon protein A, DNA transporter ATPase [Alkalibacterium sp. AK22]|uniref:DEAD/DEAH box helicase n=1 Tax=Alkalibacterium sp. AK22 TaxID=1229520 RepID=UPI0004496054|nr:helicase-related protein [Alkalibacterium sp. AK22]EXJ23671.1 ComF operon protein A, DNA transporter ATPase [Alkalibacterium sp. AK22]
MEKWINWLGRDQLQSELSPDLRDEMPSGLESRPAFVKEGSRYRCGRCGSICCLRQAYPCICKQHCYYCRECIQLGKVRACDRLISLPETGGFKPLEQPVLKWKGILSPQQEEASKDILQTVRQGGTRIVWAVTGAGKTEMLFEAVAEGLAEGKRVCIASPRIDVCLELSPRLQEAFDQVDMTTLYGGSGEVYRRTQLVIATTHQLLRFKEAFDVMIVDEIDAFPYYLNEALYYAAKKALVLGGSQIFLTATPDRQMLKAIRSGRIDATILPARYHKHPLPVPEARLLKGSLGHGLAGSCNASAHLLRLLQKKRRCLVFIPTILYMEILLPDFERQFKDWRFAWVHSKDPERKEKIQQMRQGELDFLLTTTILERGVTFADIDVIVVKADHAVYTEAALVQIAGRAGRSSAYPEGEVTFYCEHWTRPIKRSIRQIEAMNRTARKRGLLQ